MMFGKNYIYVVWQNPKTRSRRVIGILSKNGGYTFKYRNIEEAKKEGFELLIPFPSEKTKYKNDILFPAFSTRIPGPTRVDIDDILKKHNMKKYDAFELLKRSGGKTSFDNLEFIDPIMNIKEKNLTREFFIAGTSHYCSTNNKLHDIAKIGDNVELEKEPSNEYDKYAVKMLINGVMVGYIPRYYSKEVTMCINSNRKYKCTVIEVTEKCDECIKVKLVINYTDK